MLILKSIHMAAAVISILGFIARGLLMMIDSPQLQKKWIKIAPHIIDTVLLVTAISMVFMIPVDHAWLGTKLVALIVYIGLGMVALKFGKSKGQKIVAFLLAIATFGFILSVAISHNPAGFFAWP